MTSVERRYHAWCYRHPLSADVPLDIFADIYRLGGGDALRSSSELAELVPKLREVIWWLEARDDGDDVVQAGIAWGESNANAEEHAIRAEQELEDLPF